MAIRVTINGVVFECDTAAEARELACFPGNSQRASSSPAPPRRGRPPKNSDNGNVPTWRQDRARTVSLLFLKALVTAGRKGLGSEQLVPILQLKAARASGGVLRNVDKVLEGLGLERSTVFTMDGLSGQRRWHAGPQIENAVAELEKGGDAR